MHCNIFCSSISYLIPINLESLTVTIFASQGLTMHSASLQRSFKKIIVHIYLFCVKMSTIVKIRKALNSYNAERPYLTTVSSARTYRTGWIPSDRLSSSACYPKQLWPTSKLNKIPLSQS